MHKLRNKVMDVIIYLKLNRYLINLLYTMIKLYTMIAQIFLNFYINIRHFNPKD